MKVEKCEIVLESSEGNTNKCFWEEDGSLAFKSVLDHCEHVLTSRVLFVALMCCYQNTKTLSSVLGEEVHPGNIIYGGET